MFFTGPAQLRSVALTALALCCVVNAASESKHYAAAIEKYRAAVAANPGDAEAHRNLGLSFYLSGRFSQAIGPLERALALAPQIAGARLYLGICYYRTNGFVRAIDTLNDDDASGRQQAEAKYWRGASRLALKEYEPAIADLEDAAATLTGHPEALYSLARAYAEYSASLLNSLLETAPDSPAALRLRAEDALTDGMPLAAAKHLRQALSLRPDDEGIASFLAAIEESENAAAPVVVVESAPRDVLARAHRASPGDPDAVYLLGKWYQRRASEIGNELFERHPASPRVRLMRGEAFEKGQRKDLNRALEEYKAALAIEPGLPGVQYAVGRVLWKLRRWEEATAYLEAELKRNPNHGLANFYLGTALLALDRPQVATRHLRSSVEAQPGLTQGWKDLGRALARCGETSEALTAYERAVALDASDGSVHALISRAHLALGNAEQARRWAQTARELTIRRNRIRE